MSSLTATSNYANSVLGVSAAVGGTYYTRNATNLVNATKDTAVDLGSLTEDSTALRATSTVNRANSTDYYKFALDGDNLKLNMTNTTSDTTLRVQVMNSAGKVIADNEGTTAQQAAYKAMKSTDGYDTSAGDYYVKVGYGGTESHSTAQTYTLMMYSGTQFRDLYSTTAKVQVDAEKKVDTDETMTFATIDALEYSTTAYNQVNASTSNSVLIGWLSENKTALSLNSQLTEICDENYYSFTFQKGSSIKMAFTNKTDTSDLRIQIMDTTGTYVFADSGGTEAQKAAYESLLTSSGMGLDTGNYIIKVSYASGSDKTKAQTYDFKLYSGDIYTELDETVASAQTYDNAKMTGTWDSANSYSQASDLASTLYSQSQGSESDIMSVLKATI